MRNRDLNVNHIGTLIEKNGKYEYAEFDIDQPQDVIDKIKDMADSDCYSRDELWSYFTKTIKRDKWGIDYCYPANYYETFVGKANYPKNLEEKYDKILYGQDYYEEKKKRKERLAESIIRWIYARNYLKRRTSLRENNDIKVLSTESIGFSTFNYVINDDIKVQVNTNFCYGRSAYLFVNFSYKEVNILPYTAIIKFHYANMASFVNHSAAFVPARESWENVFDYLVELSNCAKEDPDKFYKKYIVDEVVGMVEGLEKIVTNPQSSLSTLAKEFEDNPFSSNTRCIYVRNMTSADYNDYIIYKNESSMAYMAEKVSNAMTLITNLKTLKPFFDDVSNYIQRIKVVSDSIIPQIEDFIPTVLKDVLRLEGKIEKLRPVQQARYAELKPLLKIKKKLECIDDNWEKAKKMLNFRQKHPEFEELSRKYQMVCDEINAIASDRDKRQSFVNKMQSCIDNMKEVLAAE